MDKQKYRLSGSPGLTLPRCDADRLLCAALGCACYIYICCQAVGELSCATRGTGLTKRKSGIT
jgi:hypothetical protein